MSKDYDTLCYSGEFPAPTDGRRQVSVMVTFDLEAETVTTEYDDGSEPVIEPWGATLEANENLTLEEAEA